MQRVKAASAVCSVAAIIALVISNHGDEIRTPRAALEIIGNAEGCRRDPYMCPAGVPTDGVGNTRNVAAGKSLEQIAADWAGNIREAERCVDRHFNGQAMPLPAFGAMVSMVFNHGCQKQGWNRDGSSTMIRKMALAGKWRSMCDQIPRWNSGGKWPGIIKRRAKEHQLCLSGL